MVGQPIVVTAAAHGLGEATVSVPLSLLVGVDGAMAVAAASAKVPLDFTYLTEFRG